MIHRVFSPEVDPATRLARWVRWAVRARHRVAAATAVLIVGLLFARSAWAGPETALRDYVAAADPAYAYTHLTTVAQPGYTIHLLSLTSQTWRAGAEVDRTLWTHWMALVVPAQVLTSTGAVLVVGGENSPTPPSLNGTEVFIAAQLAMASGSVVAIVANVPNQPLTFVDAPFPQTEDQLVAYSWDKAMDTGDWSWPLYLPMVKSIVRTMDAAQAFAPTVTGVPLQRFVVIGFSKRGAVTWLTAAVDARVAAVVPGVFDVLNMAPQFEHHYAAYGFYTSVVQDYVNYRVLRRVRAPEGQALLQVVDPYAYRGALGLPKLLINSTGDQFFLPDAARFYLSDLPGETVVRYVPNTDHSLASSAGGVTNALTGLVAWYQQFVFGAPRPQVAATLAGGVLTVRSTPPAAAARLWRAENPAARDFRRESIGEAWIATPLADSGAGSYVAILAPPVAGFAAYTVELSFPGIAGVPQTYSTAVYVTPDVEPYTVTDPIVAPRGKGYWKHQLQATERGKGQAAIDPATLAGYFPLPLFDQYVIDPAAASALFAQHGGTVNGARQQCLATRLNIAHGALGWYSPLDLDDAGPRPLWQYYQQAHQAFLGGDSGKAKQLCEAINAVDAAGQVVGWRKTGSD